MDDDEVVKIVIEYQDKTYEGFEPVIDADAAQKVLLKEVDEKGYYMLKTIKGIDIMFPYNALVNATVKLIELKREKSA